MTDIVIYVSEESFAARCKNPFLKRHFINFGYPVRGLRVGDKIYVAYDGAIRGFFRCADYCPLDQNVVLWDSDSWQECEPIKVTPFQGFRHFKNILRAAAALPEDEYA